MSAYVPADSCAFTRFVTSSVRLESDMHPGAGPTSIPSPLDDGLVKDSGLLEAHAEPIPLITTNEGGAGVGEHVDPRTA